MIHLCDQILVCGSVVSCICRSVHSTVPGYLGVYKLQPFPPNFKFLLLTCVFTLICWIVYAPLLYNTDNTYLGLCVVCDFVCIYVHNILSLSLCVCVCVFVCLCFGILMCFLCACVCWLVPWSCNVQSSCLCLYIAYPLQCHPPHRRRPAFVRVILFSVVW